jgi:hypothetical protein
VTRYKLEALSCLQVYNCIESWRGLPTAAQAAEKEATCPARPWDKMESTGEGMDGETSRQPTTVKQERTAAAAQRAVRADCGSRHATARADQAGSSAAAAAAPMEEDDLEFVAEKTLDQVLEAS